MKVKFCVGKNLLLLALGIFTVFSAKQLVEKIVSAVMN